MQEKQIIELIKGLSQASLIGDDAAYLKSENLLVSSDALIEGVHFVSDIPPYYLGWKTVAVNISDIAAMGGIPKYFLLAASLPNNCPESWLKEFMRGLNECCAEYKVLLIGGDLTASSTTEGVNKYATNDNVNKYATPEGFTKYATTEGSPKSDKIYLCGTILGSSLNGKVALRSAARVGDKIMISGFLGNSAAGLYAWQNNLQKQFPDLIEAHFKPIPKVTQGLSLIHNSQDSVCMMDSSDGLLDCLQQISEQSKVKLKIDLNKIPLKPNLLKCSEQAQIDYWQWILVGGEDYELVATANIDEDNLQNNWHIIGEVIDGKPEVQLLLENKFFDFEALKPWKHFC